MSNTPKELVKRINDLELQVAQLQRALIYSQGSAHNAYMVQLQEEQIRKQRV